MAIVRDDQIPNKTALLVLLGVIVAAALAGWVWAALKARSVRRKGKDKQREPTRLSGREWGVILAAGVVSLVPGVWVVLGDEHAVRFFGLALAWVIALLFVLLIPYLRGAIRKWYEDDPRRVPLAVALSCLSSALLAVPALVALAAALPLPQAVICTKQPESYQAAGRYVGETKDRVYLGDEAAGRIISVPSGEVTRVLVGDSAAHTGLCARGADGSA